MTNAKRLETRLNRLTAAIALYEMTDCAYTKIRLQCIIRALNVVDDGTVQERQPKL